jgi:phage baseplate assembly protein W
MRFKPSWCLHLRADKAAQALDLRVVQLQDVRVNMQGSSPIRPMLGAQMKAMVAPQATATPQDITSEVAADVLLAR